MKKIFFLVQLPPPIHGVSIVNQLILNSKIINENFITKYLDISPANNLIDIGKINFSKLYRTLYIIINTTIEFIKFKPDLVYMTLSPHGLAFYKDGILAITLKFLGANLVFHMHGKGIKKKSSESNFKKFIYKSVFNNVDIIHLSENLFNDLEGVRDLSTKIFAIPNGVRSFCNFRDYRKDKITFIYLSNLVRLKGADVLVRAISLIPKEYHKLFDVKIVGESSSQSYTNELHEIVKINNIENIEFLGPKYNRDKDLILSASDVFVLPTKNDCFPLSILEAMSAGLPVISTNEGAIPYIVERGITGEIIDNCTPEDLSTAMIKFIKNPNYLKLCSIQSINKFERLYTVQRFEQNILKALKAIANNQK